MTNYYVNDDIAVNVPWAGTAPTEVLVSVWRPDETLLDVHTLADGVESTADGYRAWFKPDMSGQYKTAVTVTANGKDKSTIFYFYIQPI